MAYRTKLIRFCFLLLMLTSLASTEISTKERIRKHQEWLKKRNQQKSNTSNALNYKATSFELANLWRFSKRNDERQKSRMNEVYPENDGIMYDNSTLITTTGIPTGHKNAIVETTTHLIESIKLSELTTSSPLTTTTTTASPPLASQTTTNPAKSEVVGILTDTPIFTSTEAITLDAPTTLTPATTSSSPTSSPSPSTSTTTAKPKPKTRPYPRWADWSKWTDCSRSCDTGIASQRRKCISRNSSTGKRYVSNDCIGLYKRYQLCNEQPCPGAIKDFRAEQCAAFNSVDFQGHSYVWEPYIKDDAECELNCKPLGMKYFATLNESVIDGTPCNRPAEYYRSNYTSRAMCVDGICRVCKTV